jgi:hypothetical protein
MLPLTTLQPEANKKFYDPAIPDVIEDIDQNFAIITAAIQQRSFSSVGFASGCDYICTGASSGATDNAQILAAATSASIAGGGTVIVKPGIYNFYNQIDLSGLSNVRILCEPGVIFQIPQSALHNFGYGFMIKSDPTGSDITLEGAFFNGGYSGYSAPPGSCGGGVNPGARWRVERCIFSDFNYFGFFIGSGTSDLKCFRNQFIGPGNGTDHIGGGQGSNIEIAFNTWEANITGNMFDNTGGNGYDIHDNYNKSNNSIYIEAMTNVKVHDNEFVGSGSIVVQSDAGYSPASLTNSRYCNVYHNKLNGGEVVYKIATDPVKSTSVGGDIQFVANDVQSPQYAGILVTGGGDDNTRWGTNIIVANNIVHNANASNSTTYNTGTGVAPTSAIQIMEGMGVTVVANTCIDDRATPQQQYGIYIGQTSSPSAQNEPNNVIVAANSISGTVLGNVKVASTTYTTIYTELSNQLLLFGGNVTSFQRLTISQNAANNGLYLGDGSSLNTNVNLNFNCKQPNLAFQMNGTEKARLTAAGQLGIGITIPSANLHLTAGTATAGTAPAKLTSGVNLTSPEDGALEYDGTHLYFTIGSTRHTII